MTAEPCPRLARELEILDAEVTHLDNETRREWIRNHERWHPCPHDYAPPAGLARNPDERSAP